MTLLARLTIALGLSLHVASAAIADTRAALVLVQSDYRYLESIPDAADAQTYSALLDSNGTELIIRQNATGYRLRTAIGELAEKTDAATGVAVLSGHFITTGQETYLLSRHMRDPITLERLLINALPLSAVIAALPDAPGPSVVLLAPSGQTGPVGPNATFGIGPITQLPVGVFVASGDDAAIEAFLARAATDPGAPILASAVDLTFVGPQPRADATLQSTAPTGGAELVTEPELWQTARARDTLDAYQDYLSVYPDGANAAAARALIDEITNEPFRAARLAEDALALSREARRKIQRDLSILGYNTRGIDGIFGPGTRGAVEAWQKRSGFEATTYLTGNQIAKLSDEAAIRAAELEEEARIMQAMEDRRDREFWEATGAIGDEAGYRAYMDRYPDGIFSPQAKRALTAIEDQRRAEAAQIDTQNWQQAQQIGTVEAYADYLTRYPDGAYRDEARRRIDALTRDPAQDAAEARAAQVEQALGLDALTRQLIEGRLRQLNLNPGSVDGSFDGATRRAIRNYQKARNMRVTGFIDEATAVRMLADVFQ